MNTINVTKRDLTVKAKKLRRNGYVPGSVFGGMLKEPVALQIEESVARQLVRELREGSRLKLDLDGTVIPVQIKEKSLDNLKHEILEISFQALSADQAVNSVIDIVLVNADKVTAVLEKLNMKIPYLSLIHILWQRHRVLRRGADRKGSGRIHCGKECADRGGHHRFWPDPGLSDRDLKAEEPGVHSSVYAAG